MGLVRKMYSVRYMRNKGIFIKLLWKINNYINDCKGIW